MTDDRVASRAAHLLPEELTVDSADPQAQASAILAESELRTAQAAAAPETVVEHRASADTAE